MSLCKLFTVLLVCGFAHIHTVKAAEPAWPCPIDDYISPCTCISDISYHVDIDCSAVTDESEIRNAFAHTFPFDDVYTFKIDNPNYKNPIINLTSGVFDDKYFYSVDITGTQLQAIEDNVFDGSHDSLTTMKLSGNELKSFPFQVLTEYKKIRSLNLQNNKLIELPKVNSPSLLTLMMNGNTNLNLTFGDQTFVGAPNLRTLYLANTGQTYLVPDMFSTLQNIAEIYISENSIKELDTRTFFTPQHTITKLYLANNGINDVHLGAISGMAPDGTIDLSYNDITVLDETIWQPIFEQIVNGGSLILGNNPLQCGCDFKWIVNNDNYLSLISPESSCHAGVLVSEISKDFINNNCD
ncbi:oplophorus-luciferin 2-monooxygenase non-catalytic subunit [Hyalella azteca]|uniref:Oplophorus-luciferin 2-monooxygenase non-catalytic subunit n=1 Tax=Hyalella azteca TaxID=294128 RepID=A0A8B7PPP6_HYAAZ|nr:oplophorus-luciferin 2-monooxygenase non-catalytic subunit [Hyalella azteca]